MGQSEGKGGRPTWGQEKRGRARERGRRQTTMVKVGKKIAAAYDTVTDVLEKYGKVSRTRPCAKAPESFVGGAGGGNAAATRSGPPKRVPSTLPPLASSRPTSLSL